MCGSVEIAEEAKDIKSTFPILRSLYEQTKITIFPGKKNHPKPNHRRAFSSDETISSYITCKSNSCLYYLGQTQALHSPPFPLCHRGA